MFKFSFDTPYLSGHPWGEVIRVDVVGHGSTNIKHEPGTLLGKTAAAALVETGATETIYRIMSSCELLHMDFDPAINRMILRIITPGPLARTVCWKLFSNQTVRASNF